MMALLALITLVACPSICESGSRVVLEAPMSAGAPFTLRRGQRLPGVPHLPPGRSLFRCDAAQWCFAFGCGIG
jgi:hypothetical protein